MKRGFREQRRGRDVMERSPAIAGTGPEMSVATREDPTLAVNDRRVISFYETFPGSGRLWRSPTALAMHLGFWYGGRPGATPKPLST